MFPIGNTATTYVLSSEIYPKNIRATFNGISAAMGKLGAVVGAYMFGPLADMTSLPAVMVVCALISIIGAFLSHYFINVNDNEDTSDYTALPDDDYYDDDDDDYDEKDVNGLYHTNYNSSKKGLTFYS